jgi:hypothetical protein
MFLGSSQTRDSCSLLPYLISMHCWILMPCCVSLILSTVTDWCRWTRQRCHICSCIWFLWFWQSVQHIPFCFCIEHSVWLYPMYFKDGDFMLGWTWQPILKQIWDSSNDNPDETCYCVYFMHLPHWHVTYSKTSLVWRYKWADCMSRHIRLLMMEMAWVSETLVCLIHLMWLWTPEDFIEWSILVLHVVSAVVVSITSLQQQFCGIKLYKNWRKVVNFNNREFNLHFFLFRLQAKFKETRIQIPVK